jgi:hypothetical protein
MERIWIYTISKQLPDEQISELKQRCQNFVSTWTAHEVSLDASFELYKNRLLIFKVNEANYNASGCSIDKQVRLVKELEQQFSVELLNRLLVAYEKDNDVAVAKTSEIAGLLNDGTINENTLVFDNTISQSTDLDTNWKKPLKDTYLSKYVVSNSASS